MTEPKIDTGGGWVTTPPVNITDEIRVAAQVAAEQCGECVDHGCWQCCIRRAVEAVAPLIAAQVLRPSVDLPAEIRGDGPCGDCDTRNNIIWFTDNVLWNVVMRQPGSPREPFLCPMCFVRRVHEHGLAPTGWRLVPDWHWETLAEYDVRKHTENGRERSPATGGVVSRETVWVGERGPEPIPVTYCSSNYEPHHRHVWGPPAHPKICPGASRPKEGEPHYCPKDCHPLRAYDGVSPACSDDCQKPLGHTSPGAPGRSLTEDAP